MTGSSQLPCAHLFSDALHELARVLQPAPRASHDVCSPCVVSLHSVSLLALRSFSSNDPLRTPSLEVPPRARRPHGLDTPASSAQLSGRVVFPRGTLVVLSRPIGRRGRQVPRRRRSLCAAQASVFDTPSWPISRLPRRPPRFVLMALKYRAPSAGRNAEPFGAEAHPPLPRLKLCRSAPPANPARYGMGGDAEPSVPGLKLRRSAVSAALACCGAHAPCCVLVRRGGESGRRVDVRPRPEALSIGVIGGFC